MSKLEAELHRDFLSSVKQYTELMPKTCTVKSILIYCLIWSNDVSRLHNMFNHTY